ncbi:hypothetical protein PHISCL_10902 [Aspergillus sclerotialis]|uniref:Uncharacterized protein n=1 Tax=Aspergillus sclerotialis TaxID=2070753 RepID=A0A3A2ZHP2_9EURO|nr:hypothetical protein PHISCL_10902 [Aspergillus sclerotialis]
MLTEQAFEFWLPKVSSEMEWCDLPTVNVRAVIDQKLDHFKSTGRPPHSAEHQWHFELMLEPAIRLAI